MKFGVEFAARSISRWKNYNIDYNLLKVLVREATTEFDDSSSSDTNGSSSSPDSNFNTNTDATSTGNDSTANTAEPALSDHQKKLLKKLYKTFKEQIDYVSLFAFSKVGEISRRLSTLKRQCNLFIESQNTSLGSRDVNSDVALRIRHRKLIMFQKELDSITQELQDLSRFILLQKFAVKKILKKFLKYSTYSKKQAFVNTMTQNCLYENQKSFIHLSLDDLSLETTLLYDFLDTFLNNPSRGAVAIANVDQLLTPPPKKRDRESSIHTIDSLQLITKHAVNRDDSQIFLKSTTFDIVSKRKGPRSLSFWVHYDNLDEIKFFLSSEFKLITDESFLTKDIKLKNTRSSMNLRDDEDHCDSGNKSSDDGISSRPLTKSSSHPSHTTNDAFCPETDTVSIWLNNPSEYFFVKNVEPSEFNYELKNHESLKTFKANPYSQILVSNYSNSDHSNSADGPSLNNNPILITPIGGLRQFSIASLNQPLVNLLFNDKAYADSTKEEKKRHFFKEWTNSHMKGNRQMTQLSIDWVVDNDVKPLASVSSKKMRYINLNKNDKIDFYISLEWDINIHKSQKGGLEDPNSNNVDKFPHAILEINFDFNSESKFPDSIERLINSYLVYRVDNLNFSLNNYLIFLSIDDNDTETQLTDDEMLLFIAPWHELLTEKDIRILPEVRAKSQPLLEMSALNMDKTYTNGNDEMMGEVGADYDTHAGILLNKHEIAPKKPGYWNEFDNGSDYNVNPDDAFYVYPEEEDHAGNGIFGWISRLFIGSCDDTVKGDVESGYHRNSNDGEYSNGSGPGLEWLSYDKVEQISSWAEHISETGEKIKMKILGLDDNNHSSMHERSIETSPLLFNTPTKRKDSVYTAHRNTMAQNFGTISEDYNADEEDEESDSETELMMSSLPQRGTKAKHSHRPMEVNTLVFQDKHDKCLSFLYLLLTSFSIFTSTLGTLILRGVFTAGTGTGQPVMTGGLVALVAFAVTCLVLSMLLTGFSICFLVFRYTTPPNWHIIIVWGGLFISTILFFYGILICF